MSGRQNRHAQQTRPMGMPQRILVGAVLIGMLMGVGWLGYEVGLGDTDAYQDRFAVQLQSMLDAERRTLDADKQATGEHLDALALRMGRMQAELMRLEALGERLVEMGRLDGAEFDFSAPPALGGPPSSAARSAELAEMLEDLNDLSRRIEDRQVKLDLLEDLLLSRQVMEAATPAGKPVESGWISSRYGWRTDPFTGKRSHHRGLDFAGKKGSGIVAVADGLVVWAAPRAGYGKTVEVRHGGGYVTRYAHNSELLVEKGDLVRQGQVIAAMGRTGRATGVHLHFEVIHDGKTLNPLRFVKRPRADGKSG